MLIQFSVVGQVDRPADVWCELDAVPREGDIVDLPGLSQAETVVRTVVWHLPDSDVTGHAEGRAFVYVVFGQPRR